MKIFLVSNSYIETMLVPNLEYLLNLKIDEIYLLKENHSNYERIKNVAKVSLCENVKEAIQLSDLVILIAFQGFSDESKEKVKAACKEYRKKASHREFGSA